MSASATARPVDASPARPGLTVAPAPTGGSRPIFRGLSRHRRPEAATTAPSYAPFDSSALPPPAPRTSTPQEVAEEAARGAAELAAVLSAIDRARYASEAMERARGATARPSVTGPCLEALERLRPVEAALRAGDEAKALAAMRHAARPLVERGRGER